MKTLRQWVIWGLILLAPNYLGAQTTVQSSGAASTLIAGTTATSGCTDGGFLYSLTSLIQCGANALNDGSVITFGGVAGAGENVIITNGTSTRNILVLRDNVTPVWTVADGGITTKTQPLRSEDGAVGTPAYSFTNDIDTGLWWRTAGAMEYSSNGAHTISFNNGGGITLGSARQVGWTSVAAPTNALDAFFERDAAATVQLGADVNGAAITQTLKAHDGITGTDIAGARLTLAPGLGTGAAVSNPLTLNRVVTRATGTTAQTYSPAFVSCPTKILSNTSATAQTIATITTTSTTGGNVTVDYTTVANNGTLQNTDSGLVKVSWNNNAGTVAAAMTAVALQSDSDASGTLATTPTATVATNVVSIRFTPTWVTIVPTTVTGWATFTLHTSGDTVACQ